MSTQLLPEPVLDKSSTRGLHWVCVEVLEPPVISLCGELTNGHRTGLTSGICPRCMELAHVHAAACPPCAYWAARIA